MLLKSGEKQLALRDIVSILDEITDKRQEHFIVLTLDTSMRLIGKHLVFLGTVNASLCHPREVFAVAIKDAASSIVVSHNHPSGDLEPSTEDINTTQQLIAAGTIVGIPVQDHIIVTKQGYFSFLENGFLI